MYHQGDICSRRAREFVQQTEAIFQVKKWNMRRDLILLVRHERFIEISSNMMERLSTNHFSHHRMNEKFQSTEDEW